MNKSIQTQMKAKKVMVFLLTLCAIVAFSNSNEPFSRARFTRSGLAFDESSRILNIGVGFGSRNYWGYNNRYGSVYKNSPALSISYEQPLSKKAGPGFIGIGGYFGFQHSSYTYNDDFFKTQQYYYKHSWNYFHLAFRAAYHADALNFEKGEVYFGLLAGFRFQTYKYSSNYPEYLGYYGLNQNSLYPSFSVFAGGRWFLTEKLGLFGELGWGISYLTLGVSLKI